MLTSVAIMLSLLPTASSAQQDLSALGDAQPFQNPASIRQLREVDFRGVWAISNDGRVAWCQAKQRVTVWTPGSRSYLETLYFVGYKPKSDAPSIGWAKSPLPDKKSVVLLRGQKNWIGFDQQNRLLVYTSDGDERGGAIRSHLGRIDLDRSGPRSTESLLWLKRGTTVIAFDQEKQTVAVRSFTRPLGVLGFKIGKDYRSSRQVIPPKGFKFTKPWTWLPDESRYALDGASEVDLRTGKRVSLNIDPTRIVSADYAGDVLLLRVGKSSTGNQLMHWNREARRLDALGSYRFEAASRNGKYLLLSEDKPSTKDLKFWWIKMRQ